MTYRRCLILLLALTASFWMWSLKGRVAHSHQHPVATQESAPLVQPTPLQEVSPAPPVLIVEPSPVEPPLTISRVIWARHDR